LVFKPESRMKTNSAFALMGVISFSTALTALL
jgi:hypothetical protein